MSEEQQLAILPAKEVALAVFSAPNGLDPYLQSVRAEIDKFNASAPDVKTKKGQAAYRSIAYDLAGSKSKLDELGKELVAELKDVPKKIDAERKRVRELLTAWQTEVRKPLTDWEDADKARIAGHKETLAWLDGFLNLQVDLDVATLKSHMSEVEAFEISQALDEFETDSARSKDAALTSLRGAILARTKHEAELADIARFNAEKAEREQQERDAAVAREAVEKAQREADQRAQAERDAAAKREQDLIDQAANAKRAAEQAARDAATAAENQRLQLQLQAEQAERAAAQAEASRLASEQRAEQELKDSLIKAERAAEEARQAEVDRQKAAAEEIVRQQNLREADKEHKKTICLAAQKALMACGIDESTARAVILLIHQRKIPAITIQY